MTENERHIEYLLQLFMNGETSLEQEQELSDYFSNTLHIPDEWNDYKKMFAYFDAGMPVETEKQKHNIALPIWALTAAAVAAIAIIIAPHLHRNPATEQTTKTQPVTVKNDDITINDTIIKPEHPHATPLLARQKRIATKEKVRLNNSYSTIDSIEIEREKGEVEQTQQELLADQYIIEQELQEILVEQYTSRVHAYQTQQTLKNENTQLIPVVFK